MQIIRNKKYLKKIQTILAFIARGSINQAVKFQNELDEHIENLVFMPYKFRKSIYFEDDSIRDLVFKEYVVPYKIDMENNKIFLIGINKYQKSL